VGAYLFSYNTISYLLEEMKIGLFLLHEFISIILFIFFLSVNAGNIIVAFSTLYKSDEVKYLFTKPINPTVIFTIKFLDNFFYSSSTLLLILLSIIGGYVTYFNLSLFAFINIILFQFMPFMLSAAAIGVIILMIVIKLTSIINPKIILYGLIILYLTAIYFFFDLSSPVKLVNEVMRHYPNVDKYFGTLIPGVLNYLPNKWLANSLYWIASGKFSYSTIFFTKQVLFSFYQLSIMMLLGYLWYQKTWLISIKLRKQKEYKKNSLFSFDRKPVLKSSISMLIKKELHCFLREPSQVIHFFILLFLITIFMFSLKGVYLMSIRDTQLQTIVYLSLFLFSVLLITTFSLRFVFPLISLDGKSFWRIKSAPIKSSTFAFIKLFPWITLIFLIGQMLNYFSNLNFPAPLMNIFSFITLCITLSITLMNFGMGGLFANFNETNPIKIASSQGASITFLLSLVFMVFLIAVLYLPLNKFFLTLKLYGVYNLRELIIASSLISLLSITISVLFYRVAVKSFEKDY
jgi:ABC-2 type transport system permease protein